MNALGLLAALIGGVGLAAQAAINARLAEALDKSAVLAATIQFAIGLAVLATALPFVSWPQRGLAALATALWWAWLGGLIGAAFVVMTIRVAPMLGVATLLAVIVTGQLAAGVTIDHFGWLGVEMKRVSIARIGGVALMIVGVWR